MDRTQFHMDPPGHIPTQQSELRNRTPGTSGTGEKTGVQLPGVSPVLDDLAKNKTRMKGKAKQKGS